MAADPNSQKLIMDMVFNVIGGLGIFLGHGRRRDTYKDRQQQRRNDAHVQAPIRMNPAQ